MGKRIDIKGKRFGLLVAIEPLPKYKYRFQCDCGNIYEGFRCNVVTGKIKACGCIPQKQWSKHGLANKTAEYRTWKGMRNRCNNPKATGYENYGGRGIKVCDRWNDFEQFLVDMGKRPIGRYSLDRIDNNGDYTPENCRWADDITQANNTRFSVKIEFEGENLTALEWSKKLNINRETILGRYYRGLLPKYILSITSLKSIKKQMNEEHAALGIKIKIKNRKS